MCTGFGPFTSHFEPKIFFIRLVSGRQEASGAAAGWQARFSLRTVCPPIFGPIRLLTAELRFFGRKEPNRPSGKWLRAPFNKS